MTKLNFDKFKPELSDAELEVQVNKPKFLKPGIYDLKVVKAELHKAQNDTDPTWAQVKLTLASSDDRQINTIVLVPMVGMKFNKPGSKSPYFLFYKFQDVLRAFGKDASTEVFKQSAASLFGDLDSIVGKVISVEVGYQGYYLERGEDEKYRIHHQDGKLFQPEGKLVEYLDRDSATVDALTYGITLSKFVEIRKFLPAEIEKSEGEVDESDPWG